MASKDTDADALRQALSAVDAEKRNVELESTLASLTEANQSLESELAKERAEKQKLAVLKAEAEASKTEAVEKYESLCQSERRLREREQGNLQTLAQQRESLNDTQQKLNNERQTNIQKAFEFEKLSNLVRSLTNNKQSLNHELEDANSKIRSLNNQINTLQENYDNLRHDSNTERSKLLEKINHLQNEKKQLQDKVDELDKELEHARIRVIQAENSLGELTRSKDQMELNLGSTQKAYKDLQAIYEEHTTNTRTKYSSYETKIEQITKEKEALAKQNKDLQDQLTQERELHKVNFNQSTPVTTQDPSGQSRLGSKLLKLIQDYQSLERRPEAIFEDYFELKEKHEFAVQSNSNLNNLIEQLGRKLREKEIEFDRLFREREMAGEYKIKLEASNKEQQMAFQQLTEANTQLQSEFSALQRDNDSLKATLNDTTYQLQHLLSVIQKRSEPVPVGLKESARLLQDADITPHLSHNDLVYDNVAQLQDLNKDLSVQNRTLRDLLKKAQNEIKETSIAYTSDDTLQKKALEEAKEMTIKLAAKVTDLQAKIQTTTTECENYKKIVNALGDGDTKAKFEQMQNTQDRQRLEMDITLQAYRKETLEEMNKLKEELFNSRASEKSVQNQLTSMEVEKRNLLVKLEKLNSHSQRLESQSNSLVRDNTLLNERILQNDQALANINKEVADYKSRLQLMREENMVLQTRYEALQSSYKEFRDAQDKETSEKEQMASLLESLKTHFNHATAVDQHSTEQALQTVENLTRELQHARDTLATTEKQLDYYKSIDQSDLQDKYKESMVEVRFLKNQIAELEQKLSNTNQERIIAQTKLATAEEQLKKAVSSAQDNSLNSSCDEHVRLLAEAEDRVRMLEQDNTAYQTIIAEKEKLISASTAEHDTLITKTQASIDKLLKDIEERNEAVQAAQMEAEKSIAEYNALKEQSVASQAELADEKAKLDDKVKHLEDTTATLQKETNALQQELEVKTNALADVQAKLESETKVSEEQRQANSALRADVSNLTFEIAQYKATIAAASATEAKLRSDLEHETAERNTAEEAWKSKLHELNKQQEQLSQSVSDLVAKYAEWAAANDKSDGPERAGFVATTEDIVKQLRETNTTLRIEKDANELNYQTERNKRRRVESELETIKSQVATLRADIARLREENKALSEESSTGALNDKMQYEAFKSQNQMLMMENAQLREAKEKAMLEQAKMESQVSPLELKISALEAELTQSKSEIEMLEKSQKEWTARSAKLLSKYNRVDPAEIDSVKAELDTTKKELEAAKTEKASVESTVEKLQAQIKELESERASLIQKANERGRMFMEMKKKFTAVKQQYDELVKKAGGSNDSTLKADIAKLTQEKESLEKRLKELEEKCASEKEVLETKIKELETKSKELTEAADEKYKNLLVKARKVQLDLKNTHNELTQLKASNAGTSDTTEKIATLEAEAEVLRKQCNEYSVEATRYKAQLSLAQGKATRLQKENDLLKSRNAASTLSPAAPVFQMGATASPISSPAPASPSVLNSPAINEESTAVATPEVVASPTPARSPAPATPVTQEVVPAEITTETKPTTPTETTEAMKATDAAVEADLALDTDLTSATTDSKTEQAKAETTAPVKSEEMVEARSASSEEHAEEKIEEGHVDKAAVKQDEVPVDVHVLIEKPSTPTNDQVDTTDTAASIEQEVSDAFDLGVATEEDATTAAELENDLNEAEEPAALGKRPREEEEDDLTGLESPTKISKTEE